jgi:multiple sugar transport system substrate-binding protein
MPQTNAFQKQAFQVQQQELDYFKVLNFTPYAQQAALEGVINKVLPGAVRSKTPAGKVADTLNTGMNALLAQGKELVQ